MNIYRNQLFNSNKLECENRIFSLENINEKIKIIKKWTNNQEIKNNSEIQMKGDFFRDIFTDVLGYNTVLSGEEEWNLCIEQKTEVDGKKPDGIIGFYNSKKSEDKTRCVIELKGFNIDLDEKQKRNKVDYGTPIEQAFRYSSKYDGCKWVIVSNLNEIRLYKIGRSENYYELFNLEEIQDEKSFMKFYLSLCKNNLIAKVNESYIEKLTNMNYDFEKQITKEFYKEYKSIRVTLIKIIKEKNIYLKIDECIRCSQKFLDRIIFICFCEGINLIRKGELNDAIERGKNSYNGIWNEIKGLFRSLDEGKEKFRIKKFNGELFKVDSSLDNCIIPDNFFDSLYKIIKYNFSYEINVEILGYIFEQSIMDIEEIKKDFKEVDNSICKGRRRKEGIYYTPEKITKFIVEITLGNYLNKKFDDIVRYYDKNDPPILKDKNGKKLNKDIRRQLIIYEKYANEMKNIKILDASCGSGAFLVQVCDFLIKEYERIEKKISNLRKDFSFNFFNLNEEVLSNNIYGVDINEESVEITKLSLWLKTVKKERPLIALNKNIKCGNSLIYDKSINNKAFNWEEEFSEVINTGGFDVIIGNPPYLKWSMIENRLPFENGEYLDFQYSCRVNHNDNQPNLYIFFIILCFKLLKSNGIFGLITSQEWLNYEKLNLVKEKLLLNGSVKNIIFDSKYSLFVDFDGKNIGTNSSFLIYEKGVFSKNLSINIPLNEENKFIFSKSCSNKYYEIRKNEKWNKYGIDFEKDTILYKIDSKESISLSDKNYFEVFGGFQPKISKINDFTINEVEYQLIPVNERNIVYKTIINAKSIDKYSIKDEGIYWIVANDIEIESDFKDNYPYLYNILRCRIESRDDGWYKFDNIRNFDSFKYIERKILSPRTKKYNSFALDDNKCLFKGTNSAIYIKNKFDIKYVLGILNSSLLTFWYKFNGGDYHGSTRKYEPKSLKILKIPIVNESIEQIICDKVESILDDNNKLKNLSIEFVNWINIKFNIKVRDDFYIMESDLFIKNYFKNISPQNLSSINKNFNYYKNCCIGLKQNSELKTQEIDEIIYSIYNINTNEKNIIKEYLKEYQ